MKLILMGDLHYHDIDAAVPGLAEARDAFYGALLGRFMDEEADLHISLGDLTNYGEATELREVYGLLARPGRTFIHVLGNHDLYAQTRSEVLKQTGQQRYHAIETEEAVLVFLDTAKEQDFADWGGWVDDEQLKWLEAEVEASGTRPMLVFGHHPLYKTTARSEKPKGSIHPFNEIWRVLGQKQGVGVYFNGHTHVDSIVFRDNWTFVQVSACLDQPAYRCLELTEDELRISAVDVDGEEVTAHIPLLHRHMQHFTPNPVARGIDSDRECVVSLRAAARL